MKVIGLIGGMGWESTVPYYRQINEIVRERLGGLHSAKIILYSIDFHEIERMQHAGDWQAAGQQKPPVVGDHDGRRVAEGHVDGDAPVLDAGGRAPPASHSPNAQRRCVLGQSARR